MFWRKRKKLASTARFAALGTAVMLAGCGDDPVKEALQRDVYSGPTARNDCVADWGKSEFCEKIPEEASQEVKQHHHGGGGGVVMWPYFWGPGYYGSNRAVTQGGSTYRPSGPTPSASVHFDRGGQVSGVSSPSKGFTASARGGFGGTAKSVSSPRAGGGSIGRGGGGVGG